MLSCKHIYLKILIQCLCDSSFKWYFDDNNSFRFCAYYRSTSFSVSIKPPAFLRSLPFHMDINDAWLGQIVLAFEGGSDAALMLEHVVSGLLYTRTLPESLLDRQGAKTSVMSSSRLYTMLEILSLAAMRVVAIP